MPEVDGDHLASVIEKCPLEFNVLIDVGVQWKEVAWVEFLLHLQVAVDTDTQEGQCCYEDEYLTGWAGQHTPNDMKHTFAH